MSESIPRATIPEHIFISFSQHDKAFAEKIVHTLRSRDIPVWIDYAKLLPGTPDWEAAIREAIDQSFAVVVLASPRSRASKYVRGELTLAESKSCPIYPLWVDGTEWSDCIPLGMTYAQFIDARQERQNQGIAELCRVLEEHIQSATPRHYFVSPIRRRVGRKPNGVIKQVSPPPGFISVNLDEEDNDSWTEGGSAVFMRISDYSCVHAFLDDLYIHYLTERFKPFTYGSSWILSESELFTGRLLLPWSWLLEPQSSSEMESKWLHETPLGECGVVPGTHWTIQTDAIEATGLAVDDERIFRAIRKSLKAEYFLRNKGVLQDSPIGDVSSDYRFHFVIFHRSLSVEKSPGMAVVQSKKNLPEDLINYWLK